ncbi:MAG: hydroxyacid dehydrogenase [Candidatus Verstraetearchaeota archaeon]|jgi:D-3-phosphoglycerate dehydrogenase|nr:hydroxyacid dehydrogenase [Candidatus Verstraetearchaeota archaeon]
MNYKVVILEPIHKDGVELLKKYCDVIECREGVSREELKNIIQDADIIISRGFIKIDAELIRCVRKAKAIVVHGVGVDHIDLKAAEEAGIKVVNTPEALTDTVAEFTIGALIALLRKIKQADEAVRRGEWSRKYTDLVGVDLKGKNVGILGLGRIGLAVAKRLKPFDVKLYYYDKIRKYDVEEDLGIRYMNFRELLSASDIILIHLPLTEETYHIISRKEFELMKNGVYIVNMGRGALIDEAELIKQIEAGKVAGAALDVFEREPLPPESPLTKYENVLLTPHLAASSVEALKRLSMDVAKKTLEILGIPVNQI